MHENARLGRLRGPVNPKGHKLTIEGKDGSMRAVLAPEALEAIVEAFRRRDWRVMAPKVRDSAIVYDEIASAAELPVGWKDVQAPGSYRLERRDDESRFGYAVGPSSWKGELLAPSVRLYSAEKTGNGFAVSKDAADDKRSAFFGVRPCEVAAIALQDRILVGGEYVDEDYLARRKRAFIVAVNCGEPTGNCFCASMGTGPEATTGFDLVLTEIADGEHRFLAEAGTDEGAELLSELPQRAAERADLDAAAKVIGVAREQMGVTLETADLHDLLLGNLEHPRYDDVAARCLACTNCTLACPTCFCTTIDDANDLTGDGTERTRKWDSCFTLQYSEMHGGGTRKSTQSRYRQWLTHKLATWQDQFGAIGCVGCGRCITWCPVGIDLREEVAAIRATQGRTP
jgi:formate hydrogenlyase subunit 6/NADH:ubiquinone oxidoreductase subunit I